MKIKSSVFLGVALLGLTAHQAHASVVVSNLDPANPPFGENSMAIGQALLTGNRPISLTSVQFQQTGTSSVGGETFSVYSRNPNGTVGSSLFTGFTLAFDSTMDMTTATVSSAFTLQANTGYFFVLASNTAANVEWTYTSSTDYAAAFGATLPAADTAFFSVGGTNSYRSLSDGPQEIQVNGLALPAVPEPSTLAVTGLALAAGVVLRARRSVAA